MILLIVQLNPSETEKLPTTQASDRRNSHQDSPEIMAACTIIKRYMESNNLENLTLFLDTTNNKLQSVNVSLVEKMNKRKR